MATELKELEPATDTDALRDELRRLVDILPDRDIPTVGRMLKGLLAMTPELAQDFAFWNEASDRTWELFDTELSESDAGDAR